MDVTSIAAAATQMSQQRTLAAVELRVLKMALDMQAGSVLQLIESAEVVPQAAVAGGALGSAIDVYA